MLNKYIDYLGVRLSNYSNYSIDTIVFCVRLWISTIFQAVILYIISILFFDIWLFFSFVGVFCSLRVMIWGYHCKTFMNCFVLTTCLFVFVGIVSLYAVKSNYIAYIGIILAIISMIYLMIVSIKDNITNAKENINGKFFFIIRILFVLIFGILSLIVPVCNEIKKYIYMEYTFFILYSFYINSDRRCKK